MKWSKNKHQIAGRLWTTKLRCNWNELNPRPSSYIFRNDVIYTAMFKQNAGKHRQTECLIFRFNFPEWYQWSSSPSGRLMFILTPNIPKVITLLECIFVQKEYKSYSNSRLRGWDDFSPLLGLMWKCTMVDDQYESLLWLYYN
jgi:hypothetical protein